MNWKKTKITFWRWEADGGFRITQSNGPADAHHFTLECLEEPDDTPEYFGTLDHAKSAAALKNELRLFRLENAELRQQLAQARGAMPTDPPDNSRGIPPDGIDHQRAPRVSGELRESMVRNREPVPKQSCGLCGYPLTPEAEAKDQAEARAKNLPLPKGFEDCHRGCYADYVHEQAPDRKTEARQNADEAAATTATRLIGRAEEPSEGVHGPEENVPAVANVPRLTLAFLGTAPIKAPF